MQIGEVLKSEITVTVKDKFGNDIVDVSLSRQIQQRYCRYKSL